MNRPLRIASLLAAAGLLAAAATARADEPPPHHKPPPEAFTACEKLKAGDACTVKFAEHTMEGTCRNGPDGTGALACAPKGPPPGGRHHGPPPPEAFTACAKLKAGDACSVKFADHTMDGTCRTGPDANSALACAPKGPPPGGGHHGPPPEAIESCKGLKSGDTCAVTLNGNTIDGTCRTCPEGDGPLACAPNGPPPH